MEPRKTAHYLNFYWEELQGRHAGLDSAMVDDVKGLLFRLRVETPAYLHLALIRVLQDLPASGHRDSLLHFAGLLACDIVPRMDDLRQRYRLLAAAAQMMLSGATANQSLSFGPFVEALFGTCSLTDPENVLAWNKLLRKDGHDPDRHADLCGFVPVSLVPVLRLTIIHATDCILEHVRRQGAEPDRRLLLVKLSDLCRRLRLHPCEAVPLYHLVFSGDEELYFGCMGKLLDAAPSFRLEFPLHPYAFYGDLVGDCDCDARLFYDRWFPANPYALEFFLRVYRGTGPETVGQLPLLRPFHLDLVRHLQARSAGQEGLRLDPLVRALSRFVLLYK